MSAAAGLSPIDVTVDRRDSAPRPGFGEFAEERISDSLRLLSPAPLTAKSGTWKFADSATFVLGGLERPGTVVVPRVRRGAMTSQKTHPGPAHEVLSGRTPHPRPKDRL